jgi:hypothetical protein
MQRRFSQYQLGRMERREHVRVGPKLLPKSMSRPCPACPPARKAGTIFIPRRSCEADAIGRSTFGPLKLAAASKASGDGNLGNGHPMAYVDKLQTGLAGARSPFKDRIPVPDDRPRSFAINIDPRQEQV